MLPYSNWTRPKFDVRTKPGRGAAAEPEFEAGTLARVSTVHVTDVYAHYVMWHPGHPHETAIPIGLDWLRSEVRRRCAPPKAGRQNDESTTKARRKHFEIMHRSQTIH